MDLEKQQEYDELPYFGEANQASSAANRKIAEKMSTLLIVYGKEGMEWSISPAGQRLVRRELPRRSWFHKHEYVEILYVIEGSFTQILLGEEIRFEQGEFVITDQNCEHADYIEAKDAAVLFLQIRSDYLEQRNQNIDQCWQFQHGLYDEFPDAEKAKSIREVNLPHDYMMLSLIHI